MRIGIDLGGTKTEVICLNVENGKELYRHRVPTPENDYAATIRNMADLVAMAEKTLGTHGTVGVGIPGTVSSVTGLVKNANSTWLNGQPLDKDLSAALKRPVRVENDANCFAVSEAVDGAAAGKRTVFGVIIGTGCGAGLVVDGRSVMGLNGIGGEWGHNPLPFPRVYHEDPSALLYHFDAGQNRDSVINPTYAKKGRPEYFTKDRDWNEYPGEQCYCGKRGCIETWISGTGFKKEYARINSDALATHDIIQSAEKGEPRAVAALDRYIDRLARCLAGVVNIFDPDIIVLGGGMSNVAQLYDGVPKVWENYIFSDTCHTKIVPPRHGDSSGVRGAAWLWDKNESAENYAA
ncbi:MAG: ROK family protein [Micavibrio sp.]